MKKIEFLIRKSVSMVTSIIICFVSCFVIPITVSVQAENLEAENIIINGDAESGTTDYWTWTNGKTFVNELNSQTSIYSGANTVSAAHLNVTSGGTRYFYMGSYCSATQTVELKPNTQYVINMLIYSADGSNAANITVSDEGGQLFKYSVSANYKWADASFTFTTVESTKIAINVYSGKYNYFAFDNLKIKEVKYLGYVKNGDGSCGTTDGWSWTSGKSFNCYDSSNTFSDSDVEYVASRHRTLFTDDSHFFFSSANSDITQILTLEPNSSYILELDYLQTSPSSIAVLDDDIALLSQNLSKGYEWSTGTYGFTTGSNGTVTLKLHAGSYQFFAFDNLGVYSTGNEIVTNGAFEFGTFGWNVTDSSENAVANVIKIDNKSALNIWWGKSVSQNVALKANKVYKLSFSHRREGLGNESVDCMLNIDIQCSGTSLASAQVTSGSWATHELLFVSPADAVTALNFSAVYGNYCISQVALVELNVPIGDVNCDESITNSDMIYLRKHMLGMENIIFNYSADVNSDGKIDIRDLIHIKKYFSGIITEL